MSAPTRTTPRTVRLSVWLYSRLLVAYPQPFRQEYGGQMSQVFRDCCREAAATNGNIGLTHYWLIAFGDLVIFGSVMAAFARFSALSVRA